MPATIEQLNKWYEDAVAAGAQSVADGVYTQEIMNKFLTSIYANRGKASVSTMLSQKAALALAAKNIKPGIK